MARAVIYARKSTESEDRQVLSIESQIRELQRYATKTGLKIQDIYTESKSAKSPGRPVFSDVLKKVQASEVDILVCWKLDRLARNPVDGGFITWALEEKKLKRIVTPQREFENSSNDKFWMHLEFGMAKKYVDDLSDNVRRGMKAKLEMGWAPNLPPLGYLNEPTERTIVRDPERFPIIRKMWDLMLSGNYTPTEIQRIASDHWGLRTRQFRRSGGRPFNRSAVYKLFHNPFYYGAIVMKGEIYQGQHEPMISRQEFDQVQRILECKSRKRTQKHEFAYTGLITCGNCGASITAEIHRRPSGKQYVYYHCTRRKRGIKCTEKMVDLSDLELQVLRFLHSIKISKHARQWLSETLASFEQDHRRKQETVLQSVQKRISRVKSDTTELLNLKLKKLIEDDEYIQKKNELHEELARLEGQLDALQDADDSIEKKCDAAFRFAEQAEDLFVAGNDEQRRTILQSLGSNITLERGNLNIQAHKPLEIIRVVASGLDHNSERFEQPKRSQYSRYIGSSESQSSSWWGVVDDIRTWIAEHSNEMWFLQPFEYALKEGYPKRPRSMKETRRKLQVSKCANRLSGELQ